MRTLLLFILLAVSTVVRAEGEYQVDLLSPGRAYLFVDKAWQQRAECIEAKFTVKDNVDAEGVIIKAYFYSLDGTIIHTENQPTPQGDGHGAQTKLPSSFVRGKKYSYFFAIPDKIKAGANKWKRVVVVFGMPGKTDAKIYPKDDLAKFSYPEKMLSTK